MALSFFRRGRHRGKYVEEPAWSRPPGPYITGRSGGFTCFSDGSLAWEGPLTFSSPLPGDAWIEIVPDSGAACIPALVQGPLPEEDIRAIVQDELAATPVYTGLRYEGYGKAGSPDLGLSDNSSVRIPVSDGFTDGRG